MSERLVIRRAVLWDGRYLGLRDVVIAGERIAEVLAPGTTPSLPGDWEVQAGGRVLAPGFVDAHTHLHRGLARMLPVRLGPGPRFEERLKRFRLPFERALTVEDVEVSARALLCEAARTGVTCVFDHLHAPNDVAGGLEAIARAARAIGIRVIASHATSEVDGRDAARDGLAANERFARSVAADPRVRGQLGLEASFVCGNATLELAAAAAQTAGTGVHVHAGEDDLDLAQTYERHGMRPVMRLAQAELLGPSTIVAHAVTLDRSEADLLADLRAPVALTPRATRSAGSLSVLGSGAAMMVGTDGLVGDVRQDQLVELLGPSSGRAPRNEVPAPFDAARDLAASMFGGRAADTGYRRLSPGALADLALLDHRPTVDTGDAAGAELQILSAPVAWTIVGGQVVVREGRLLTADEDQEGRRLREHSRRICTAMGIA